MILHLQTKLWLCEVQSAILQILHDQYNYKKFILLTYVSHTAHVIDIGWTSVRLSVTRWYCVETAQPIVKLSLQPDSPMIL